jgi:hypothetical protein
MYPRCSAKILAAAAVAALAVPLAGTAAWAQSQAPEHAGHSAYTVTRILSGESLSHTFTPAGSAAKKTEALTQPDDITLIGGHIFTAFQNGVGPQGQASTDGNLDSTIVELSLSGKPLRQWDIKGKCDGLTADPAANTAGGLVVATVNEDANSSLYTVAPWGGVEHYAYSKPLPHQGGTDAISFYRGRMLISASAPGTTGAAAPQPGYPAVYAVTLDRHVAKVQPVFYDESAATAADGAKHGQTVRLALTDPDSNEVVPGASPRFSGDFMLTSQADQEQIYVRDAGERHQQLAVLSLSQSVDDTQWVTDPRGRLYAADHQNDAIDMVTGRFRPGTAIVAVTPCDSGTAPATCPAPPKYPANYLGTVDMFTGKIIALSLSGPDLQPQGLVFVP